MKLGLSRAPSCADVSETVAVALPCQSGADVWMTVAMALPCQSCADGRDGSCGCAAPKLCRRVGTIAKAMPRQSSAQASKQARRPRLRLTLS